MSLDWEAITVEEGDLTHTPCDCCSKTTTVASGDLEGPDGWLGFYDVRFLADDPSHGAIYFIYTGDWRDGAAGTDRWHFAVEHSVENEGFMVLDTKGAHSEEYCTCLDRDDLVGSPYAPTAFAMLDAIFMKDSRLELFRP